MTKLKFAEDGLIPVVIQEAETQRVLMLAYMNEEALQKTIATGQTWFYSRRRQELWHKGATSGHFQQVKRIDYDCDGDALLVQVEQVGGSACHTGATSCFYETLFGDASVGTANFLAELAQIIEERKITKPAGSYVAKLFEQGLDRILKKVGEEAGEVIIAAKNQDRTELIYESSDLFFHLLVLLSEKNVTLAEVLRELARRHRPATAGQA
ncbi:MAG: bifunctional phosphoribosyl-AMP cyclohydrolase/phosphoribosyl-ATP diphosphatase HisIE [Dethiobacter sp.]|nr:bifunctional phosphoribosyl-AMP cyclohydrolase/phosphoribosyl-ATP diphosphatase HisIE [Dethiobacter sp.]